MEFFQARPERGAMRAYVPSGMAMERSVLTSALPRAGTTLSCALQAGWREELTAPARDAPGQVVAGGASAAAQR